MSYLDPHFLTDSESLIYYDEKGEDGPSPVAPEKYHVSYPSFALRKSETHEAFKYVL